MPKKNKPRPSARAARKSIDRRTAQSGNGRAIVRRAEESRPDFLADSISALRLGTIPGAKTIAGQSKIGGFALLIDSFSKCVKKLYPKQTLKSPSELKDYEVFAWWQQKLKDALPVGADYYIGGDGSNFWVDIFQSEDFSEWVLYHLYCDDILRHLKQSDGNGYEIFVRFLNQLAHTIKMDTWASGVFAEGIDYLIEILECEPDSIGEDQLPICKAEIDYYTIGEGAELTKKVHRDASPGIKELLKQSSRVKDPFIRELIRLGCELMEPGYSMTDFVDVVGYDEDRYSEMGLRFDSQASLMLLYKDQSHTGYEYDSRIEMHSSEGGFCTPYNQVRIRPGDKKKPDLASFQKRREWLEQLTYFFHAWVSVAKFYYDERVEQQIEITVQA